MADNDGCPTPDPVELMVNRPSGSSSSSSSDWTFMREGQRVRTRPRTLSHKRHREDDPLAEGHVQAHPDVDDDADAVVAVPVVSSDVVTVAEARQSRRRVRRRVRRRRRRKKRKDGDDSRSASSPDPDDEEGDEGEVAAASLGGEGGAEPDDFESARSRAVEYLTRSRAAGADGGIVASASSGSLRRSPGSGLGGGFVMVNKEEGVSDIDVVLRTSVDESKTTLVVAENGDTLLGHLDVRDVGDNPFVDGALFNATLNNHSRKREDENLMEFSKMTYNDLPFRKEEVRSDMKHRIRFGLPQWLRYQVWPAVTDALIFHADHPSFYLRALERVFGESAPAHHASCPTFSAAETIDHVVETSVLSDLGVHTLHRLLFTLGAENPDLSFCPSLPYLVATLLTFVSEEDAYTIAHCILEDSRDCRFYLNLNRGDMSLFVETFKLLIDKKFNSVFSSYSGLFKHMRKLKVDLTGVLSEWFSRLFVGCLPFQTVLRIFDCFLFEGSKVLYRTGLALLAVHRDALLKTADADEFVRVLRELCAITVDVDSVFELAFDFQLKRKTFRSLDTKSKKDGLVEPGYYAPARRYYYPKFDVDPTTTSPDRLTAVWPRLPSRYRMLNGTLVYTSDRDGFSLSTLLRIAEGWEPLIVLVRVEGDACLGFFAPQGLSETVPAVVSGETFVFSLEPEVQSYHWNERRGNERRWVDVSTVHGITLGAGGGGPAIRLDADLERGATAFCDTYDSEPLVAAGTADGSRGSSAAAETDGGGGGQSSALDAAVHFRIIRIEVYGMTEEVF